jgi:hypothetical protein
MKCSVRLSKPVSSAQSEEHAVAYHDIMTMRFGD